MKTKICTKCKKRKQIDKFWNDKSKKDGKHYHCIKCQNKNKQRFLVNNPSYFHNQYVKKKKQLRDCKLRHKYGITLKEYTKLLKQQKHLCAICRQKETRKYKQTVRSLAVDHNHKTGKIRGLLCQQCNLGIGHFKEDIKIMYKAILYLKGDKNDRTI